MLYLWCAWIPQPGRFYHGYSSQRVLFGRGLGEGRARGGGDWPARGWASDEGEPMRSTVAAADVESPSSVLVLAVLVERDE